MPPCRKTDRPVSSAISAATYELRPRSLALSCCLILESHLCFLGYPIRIFLPKICTHSDIKIINKIDKKKTHVLTLRNFPSLSQSCRYDVCKSHFPAAMLPSIFSFLESLMHKRCVALLSYLGSVDTSPPRFCITCSYAALSY